MTAACVTIGVTTTIASTDELADRRHHRCRPAFARAGHASFRSRNDSNVASERSKVAQNVYAPFSAPDLPDDHGPRS